MACGLVSEIRKPRINTSNRFNNEARPLWPGAEKIPQAIHVLDRFHIMQRIGKAIDKVRASEVKQLKQDAYKTILKRYPNLAVFGRNLHVLGKLLIAQHSRDTLSA